MSSPVLRFRNISGLDLNLGRMDGPVVKAGDVAQVDGKLAEETDDAYIVGTGETARAWPKETWKLIKSGSAAAAGQGGDES